MAIQPHPTPQIRPEAEREAKAMKAARLLCMMSIFAFASFAAVDPFMIDSTVLPLYATRFIIISGALLLLWLSQAKQLESHGIAIGSAVTIWTGMGVVVLTEQTGGSDSLYWTMLMLTYFTAALLNLWRPIHAAGCFLFIKVFYVSWLSYFDGIGDSQSWTVSNAGLWVSIIVSVLAVVYLDQLREKDSESRERLQKLNAQLLSEISERKKAENELIRTQQLDAVGRLAAGMAHELNNALLVISCAAESIQNSDSNKNKHVSRILESSQKGAQLTSDLLLFARKNHRENLAFPLNDVVEDVAGILSTTQRSDINIATNLSNKNPWIQGDRQLISQALLNLGFNGIDAMGINGNLTIATKESDQWVELKVIDTGKGMSKEEVSRAFEPFYTTKAPGKGTGLGLSMVYGTISDHDGQIQIESTPQQGTKVAIKLPKIDLPTSRLKQTNAKGDILLVDHDAVVRTLLKDILEERGYSVSIANTGKEAAHVIKEAQQSFRALLINLKLPQMDGLDLIAEIRQINANQPALLYAGERPAEKIDAIHKHPFTDFIQKPFRKEELLSAVTKLCING